MFDVLVANKVERQRPLQRSEQLKLARFLRRRALRREKLGLSAVEKQKEEDSPELEAKRYKTLHSAYELWVQEDNHVVIGPDAKPLPMYKVSKEYVQEEKKYDPKFDDDLDKSADEDEDMDWVPKFGKRQPTRDSGDEYDSEDVDDEQEQDKDDEDDAKYVLPLYKSRYRKEALNSSNLRYKFEKQGYEVLPYMAGGDKDFIDLKFGKVQDAKHRHHFILFQLLFLSMLSQKWNNAFKAFSLLLRFKYTDITLIWPLGIEILCKLNEDKIKSKYPDIDPYDLQVLNLDGLDIDLGPTPKDEQFYEWLETYYTARYKKIVFSLNSYKLHKLPNSKVVSTNILNHCWVLLIRRKYSQLDTLLAEMILVPPFSLDGNIFYIHSLCFMLQANEILKSKESFDGAKVEELLVKCEQSLKTASSLNCEFPENLIKYQISEIRFNSEERAFTGDSPVSSTPDHQEENNTNERNEFNDFNFDDLPDDRERNIDSEDDEFPTQDKNYYNYTDDED